MNNWLSTESDISYQHSALTPCCPPGQLGENNEGGRVGQLFSAQPCYQVSLTLLMRTATAAALQIANTHKEACKHSKLLLMYHMSVC